MEPNSINQLDPNHTYVYRGGEFGDIFTYWYQDTSGNYWLYSNAPEGHEDHDPWIGAPLLNPEQPIQHLHPEFFSPEGYKLNREVLPEAKYEANPQFTPSDRMNCWFGMLQTEQGVSPVYLDRTVRENLYLFVQQQLRIVDAQLPKLRRYYATLFASKNAHDKLIACMLILIEQGFFSVQQLLAATVGDCVLRGDSVILLGKKLAADTPFIDFLVSLTKGKDLRQPLFSEPTFLGDATPVPATLLYSTLAFLNISPVYLPYARASLTFSQIMHKNLETGVPSESAEQLADKELAESLYTTLSVRNYVNPQLRNTLIEKYSSSISKSFGAVAGDNYGVLRIDSSRFEMSPQEVEYSQWLHSMPLHVLSAGELGL